MERALHQFWSRFCTAYDETTVPTGDQQPKFPYITYNTNYSNFDEPFVLHASIWDRGTSWERATSIQYKINNAIGPGGLVISDEESGMIWVKRLTPFSQRMMDEDPDIRRIYINIEVENLK